MKLNYLNTYYKLPILDGLELLNAQHHHLNFPFHSHHTYNLTLILEQTFSTKLHDRILHAPVGSIVITNPGEVHASICDSIMGTSFFTFYISPDVFTTLNNKKSLFFDTKIINDPILFQQLFFLFQHFKQHNIEKEDRLMAALKLLITRYSTTMVPPLQKNTFFQDFLQNETFEKFSLENTARKFGIDKFKFIRLFKYETGLTPNNYIVLKRIEKCKELLQSHHNLLEIAIQTGFYDATHLCMHFKKITGITPLTYHHANSVLQYLTIKKDNDRIVL